VDSSIDEVIGDRQGVCQDVAHLTLALARSCGIPCRYVSGYLARPPQRDDAPPDESHAWVEAWIPELGWRGFDPTHDTMAGERYIRVAVGRDYADVPPTRGVCKGNPRGRLTVGVRIWPANRVPADRDPNVMLRRARSVPARNVEQTGMTTGGAEQ
jgi:transglutaminase-like putative cysteine protease